MESPVSSLRGKNIRNHTCAIQFNGLICRNSCSAITAELIKYVLQQREQVPEWFHNSLFSFQQQQQQAQQQNINFNDYNHPASSSSVVEEGNGDENQRKGMSGEVCEQIRNNEHIKERNTLSTHRGIVRDDMLLLPEAVRRAKGCILARPSSLAARKRDLALDTASQIFGHLHDAFSQSVIPIQKVAFILGSSLVTPKDTFILSFPANHIEGENIPLETVKKKFFREIVTSDFIGSFSQLSNSCSLRKLFVLVQAGRSSGITWFTPAPRFSLSSRGSTYNINLVNEPINSSICVSESDSILMEVSGVNLIETSMERTDSPCAKRCKLHHSFEEFADSEELIWYQAPVTFKGFK